MGKWLEALAALAPDGAAPARWSAGGAGRVRADGRGGPGDRRKKSREVLSERLRFLRRGTAAAPLGTRVRRLHRGGARVRVSRGVPAGPGGGFVSAARARRSAAAGRFSQRDRRRLCRCVNIATFEERRASAPGRGRGQRTVHRVVSAHGCRRGAAARSVVLCAGTAAGLEGRLPKLKEFETQAREAAPARLNWPAPRETSPMRSTMPNTIW